MRMNVGGYHARNYPDAGKEREAFDERQGCVEHAMVVNTEADATEIRGPFTGERYADGQHQQSAEDLYR